MDGPLVIGDGTDTALVQETASYQIGSGSTSIRVEPSGSFGLDGHNDVIGPLTLDAGTVEPGKLVTLDGGVTTIAATSTATISGQIALGNDLTFLVVVDAVQNGPDLDVPGDGYFGQCDHRDGAGTLELDGSNTYSGNTTIDGASWRRRTHGVSAEAVGPTSRSREAPSCSPRARSTSRPPR